MAAGRLDDEVLVKVQKLGAHRRERRPVHCRSLPSPGACASATSAASSSAHPGPDAGGGQRGAHPARRCPPMCWRLLMRHWRNALAAIGSFRTEKHHHARYSVFPNNADAGRARRLADFRSGPRSHVARGRFTVALTGGSSPVDTYERLAKMSNEEADWDKWVVFLGDDRFVPADDKNSNYGQARRTFGPCSRSRRSNLSRANRNSHARKSPPSMRKLWGTSSGCPLWLRRPCLI